MLQAKLILILCVISTCVNQIIHATDPSDNQTVDDKPIHQGAISYKKIDTNLLSNSLKDIPDLLKFQDAKKDPLLKLNPIEPLHSKWYETYKYFDKHYDLQLGFAYTSLYQRASASLFNNGAAGGDFDFFGMWIINNKESLHPFSIGFATEVRSSYTDTSPADLGIDIGSLWNTVTTFNRQSFCLTQIWAEYHLIRKKLEFHIGKLDLTDYFNLYSFINYNFNFLNSGLTSELSTPFPSNGLSFLVGYKPTKNSIFLAAIADANGDKTNLSFDTFFNMHEYFTIIEYMYRPEFAHLGKGNYNIMLWHSDKRKSQHIPSGYGLAVSMEQEIGNGWLPFIRYGVSHGDIKAVQQSLSTGIGLLKPFSRQNDEFACGLTWGRPRNTRRDQLVFEAYYRIQLTAHLQITPDIEVFFHPTHNETKSTIGVFSVRARIDM